jgi:hypothetical protein
MRTPIRADHRRTVKGTDSTGSPAGDSSTTARRRYGAGCGATVGRLGPAACDARLAVIDAATSSALGIESISVFRACRRRVPRITEQPAGHRIATGKPTWDLREPVAVQAARRIGEVVRGHGPVERPEPRLGPTSQFTARSGFSDSSHSPAPLLHAPALQSGHRDVTGSAASSARICRSPDLTDLSARQVEPVSGGHDRVPRRRVTGPVPRG